MGLDHAPPGESGRDSDEAGRSRTSRVAVRNMDQPMGMAVGSDVSQLFSDEIQRKLKSAFDPLADVGRLGG